MANIRKGYAGTLVTDGAHGLVISRPDLQDDLTAVVEKGAAPISYLNEYHAESEVTCAFCAKHTPHRHGFTVVMKDGRTALCGRDCAQEFFGVTMAKSLAKDLDLKKRVAATSFAMQKLQAHIPEVLAALTPKLIEFEEKGMAAAKAIHSEVQYSDVLRIHIPGLDAVRAANFPSPRLKAVRDTLTEWQGIQSNDSAGSIKALGELTKFENHLAAGLRFVKNAAILFVPDNFKVFSDSIRGRGVDHFSIVTEMTGALLLRCYPRDGSKATSYPLGHIPEIPERLTLTP